MTGAAPTVWLAMSETLVARYDEALAAAGVRTAPLALTRLAVTDVGALRAALRAREHDVALLTSANAVAFLEPSWAAGWSAVCVGARTAHAAAGKGFDVILVGAEGAAALAEQLLADMPAIERILFLRGREARDEATERLRQAGRTVDEVVAYALDEVPGAAKAIEAAPAPDAVLVGSPRAAEFLDAAVGGLAQHLAGVAFLTLGATTAERLDALGVADVRTARRPGPEAVLALLA